MKESIYTIPISEAFEERDGCPLCRVRQTLENRWVEYITGAAMMEPDVRQETNRLGFCSEHYADMLEQKNRLPVALILQTHLAEMGERLKQKPGFYKNRGLDVDTCFVCDRVRAELDRLMDNLVVFWSREKDFQKLYMQQEYVCMKDCDMLLKSAGKKLRGQANTEFSNITRELASKRLNVLKSDIDAFCKLFDYRSAGGEQPPQAVAEAIESTISFLTGE